VLGSRGSSALGRGLADDCALADGCPLDARILRRADDALDAASHASDDPTYGAPHHASDRPGGSVPRSRAFGGALPDALSFGRGRHGQEGEGGGCYKAMFHLANSRWGRHVNRSERFEVPMGAFRRAFTMAFKERQATTACRPPLKLVGGNCVASCPRLIPISAIMELASGIRL
jgi:hypothetical protein